jgi:hypothetical protein
MKGQERIYALQTEHTSPYDHYHPHSSNQQCLTFREHSPGEALTTLDMDRSIYRKPKTIVIHLDDTRNMNALSVCKSSVSFNVPTKQRRSVLALQRLTTDG